MSKKQLIFATGNANKVKEVNEILGDKYVIKSLKEIGFYDDIPEPHDTLQANALEKARVIYQKMGVDCFSEDTGLEVDSLNGEPGVLSARYAGTQKNANDNMKKLLVSLEGETNRAAQFRTVVALIIGGEEFTFEGIIRGVIISEKRGEGGFGYDPIFMPDGYDKTFAELSSEIKNKISHRALAIQKLFSYLHTL